MTGGCCNSCIIILCLTCFPNVSRSTIECCSQLCVDAMYAPHCRRHTHLSTACPSGIHRKRVPADDMRGQSPNPSEAGNAAQDVPRHVPALRWRRDGPDQPRGVGTTIIDLMMALTLTLTLIMRSWRLPQFGPSPNPNLASEAQQHGS